MQTAFWPAQELMLLNTLQLLNTMLLLNTMIFWPV